MVVAMQPACKRRDAGRLAGVGTDVGPLLYQGAVEALNLAVGLGPIGPAVLCTIRRLASAWLNSRPAVAEGVAGKTRSTTTPWAANHASARPRNPPPWRRPRRRGPRCRPGGCARPPRCGGRRSRGASCAGRRPDHGPGGRRRQAPGPRWVPTASPCASRCRPRPSTGSCAATTCTASTTWTGPPPPPSAATSGPAPASWSTSMSRSCVGPPAPEAADDGGD
jgi:hypothetical protein